ncbi:AMP-binding protein [Frigidibacter albus]|uniref:AMP-binding protein n=1 Tax=Frigidibacter albus TaxID=1465486 RepID=A0A6L8VL83_9RHOB|nr:AMP-binding protein [Frigidibacter albus]MZQ91135.1 AMP-binding protein [Frigidibacter albus]NBE33054.1 AMP-binding protein [Frigidibacter albus]GGH62968.1 feruloyl-CoA synthase [Frigidibacter albus]
MENKALYAPVVAHNAATGEVLLTGPQPRRNPFDTVGDMLRASAGRAPDCSFLIMPHAPGAKTLSYRDALAGAEARARAMIAAGLGPERPLAILSGNSIEHALMALGAMLAGVPYAPLSVPYSQLSDRSRLHAILDCLTPGLVWVETEADFHAALTDARALGLATTTPERGANGGLGQDPADVPLPLVGPADMAKVLFTSGSTGAPKGVITTHRMICTNQEAMAERWPFLLDEPPTIVEWLPWNHCFGGNLVFACALRHAGTLVIDAGRPMPAQFDATIRNLLDHPPTVHFGVPLGFTELVARLEADEGLAAHYFSRLKRMFTAGAALPGPVWDSYLALADRHARPEFRAHVSWGSTETAPVVTLSPDENRLADNLGVPVPGCEVKLVPNDEKMELRLRGPMVTPGYWRRPDLTGQSFDEDGFYRIGDAGKLIHDGADVIGIRFDGRTAENFKLVSGTWVQVGTLRLVFVGATRPVVQDAVITGHDRDEIGALVFLSLEGARATVGLPEATLAELAQNTVIQDSISRAMAAMGGRGSTRIARALILSEPPSLERGELTDKGYLNQRAALRHRAEDVARLHAATPSPDVIIPGLTPLRELA